MVASRTRLEERVAELERQVDGLLADKSRVKDWRRTRGAFTGDDLMQQVFEEGRRIRQAERKAAKTSSAIKRKARS